MSGPCSSERCLRLVMQGSSRFHKPATVTRVGGRSCLAAAEPNAGARHLRARHSAARSGCQAPAVRVAQHVTTQKYTGMEPLELQQALQAHHPGLLDAMAATAAGMAPATAAAQLRRLEAELPPTLTELAPSGDSVLVAVSPGLLPVMERAAQCCEASLRLSRAAEAAATARAALSLLSCLQFGGAAAAAPYGQVAVRCKQALKAAYDAGLEVAEQHAAELEMVCARGSRWLWLTPHFGHRYAGAVHGFAMAGWSDGELAVRYIEAYTTLLAAGRYQQVEAKYERMLAAALRHRLSLKQLGRLLACTQRLPVEMSIALELHARSQPLPGCWRSRLHAMHAERQQELEQRRSLRARLGQLPQPAASAQTTAEPLGAAGV